MTKKRKPKDKKKPRRITKAELKRAITKAELKRAAKLIAEHYKGLFEELAKT